ncbi:hypothetical protein C8J56DRAFT_900094 [Mycena floridula]|nr:hypothetical protein C8J56DRAFT_900094 [Mycena floridula]
MSKITTATMARTMMVVLARRPMATRREKDPGENSMDIADASAVAYRSGPLLSMRKVERLGLSPDKRYQQYPTKRQIHKLFCRHELVGDSMLVKRRWRRGEPQVEGIPIFQSLSRVCRKVDKKHDYSIEATDHYNPSTGQDRPAGRDGKAWERRCKGVMAVKAKMKKRELGPELSGDVSKEPHRTKTQVMREHISEGGDGDHMHGPLMSLKANGSLPEVYTISSDQAYISLPYPVVQYFKLTTTLWVQKNGVYFFAPVSWRQSLVVTDETEVNIITA